MIMNSEKKSFPRMNFYEALLLFLFTASFFFTAALNIGSVDFEGIGANVVRFQIHNGIFILMTLYLVFVCKKFFSITIPSFWLFAFFLYSMSLLLFYVPEFGLNTNILNITYALAVVIIIYNLYRDFDMQQMIAVIGIAFIFALIACVINMILQANQFISYIRAGGGDHPSVRVFTGGGGNVESTLLGIYALFVMHKKYGMFIWTVTFLISCLHASRTGFIVNILVLAWYLVYVRDVMRHISVKKILITFIALSAVIYFCIDTPVGQIVINRFVKTGEEVGSVDRLVRWTSALEVMQKYPFGVGAGNSMQAVKIVTGYGSGGSNLHNIFIAYAVDEGFVAGSLFLLCGVLWVLKRELKIRFQDPFGAYMLIYFAQGLFQSRGFDVFGAASLGFYFISRRRDRLPA